MSELTKAYSRGYYAGMTRRWPAYHPPKPPDPIARELMDAAARLADAVADWCGRFGEDDEFSKQLRPICDAVDAAQGKVTAWLREEPMP